MDKIVCLPLTYEFGGELLKNVYQVNGIDGYKIVCHEKGKECLYPGADERFYVEKGVSDDEIKSKFGKEYTFVAAGGYCRKAKPFIPEVKNYGIKADVVIFPRKKKNNAQMNWNQWDLFVNMLQTRGVHVFAAGHPDNSFHPKCASAWDYDNYLEATICAIMNSSIRVGLITALSVLSLMCGKEPWILTDPNGNKCLAANIGVNIGYLRWADHKKVGWKFLPHLDDINHAIYEIRRNHYESFRA